MRLLLILILLILFNLFAIYVNAQEDEFIARQDIAWLQTQAFGTIAPDYQYMLELQSRYNRSPKILNVTVVRPAIIYLYNEDISLWFGYAFFADLPERAFDTAEYENRIWQQIFLPVFKSDSYELFSRTRIEQREDPIDPQWAFRFRQQYTLNFLSLLPTPKVIPYISEEILLNFNNPEWVGERFVDQFRVYTGLEFTINDRTVVDLSYFLRIIYGIPKNRYNSILYFRLSLNLDSSSNLLRGD